MFYDPIRLRGVGISDSLKSAWETGAMVQVCDKMRDLFKIISFVNDSFSATLTSPALCMLGIIPKHLQVRGHDQLWCTLAMLTGCRIIEKSITPS